jgi:hypothetical protein
MGLSGIIENASEVFAIVTFLPFAQLADERVIVSFPRLRFEASVMTPEMPL